MNSIIISGLVHALATFVLGTGILEQFEKAVDAWADKEIDGLSKKAGVINQLKAEGLVLTERAFNRGVELALILAEQKSST
jgi:hypothetical protein